MSKPHITYFHMGFLPGYFAFTDDPKAFAREMKRMKVKDAPAHVTPGSGATTHHFYNQDGDVTSIVVLNRELSKSKTREQIHAVIAHEAVHVWQENKKFMAETEPGREIEAYAIQYFTQCMLNALPKGKRK